MKKRHGFTGATLKYIAMGLMLLDHTGKLFGFYIYDFLSHTLNIGEPMADGVFALLISLGGISFWIFAYFCAEGCRYTKDRKTYLKRLLQFGILSEIPFQIMVCILLDEPVQLQIGLTNIFFTLFLGAFAITGYERFRQTYDVKGICLLPCIASCLLAYGFQVDYGVIGILTILCCYFIKKKWQFLSLALCILLHYAFYVIDLLLQGQRFDSIILLYVCAALFSVVLLTHYNGERGKQNKWLFYLFYPLHIIALDAIVYILS